MLEIRIEDEVEDVLRKAMRGRGISIDSLVASTGQSLADVSQFLSGDFASPAGTAVTERLGLSFKRLAELDRAVGGPQVDLPEGVIMDNTPYPVPGYEEMTVNSYQICPPNAGTGGFAIDTGAHADALIARLRGAGYRLKALFLTHTHHDHVAAFKEVSEMAEAVFAPALEPFEQARPVHSGDQFDLGEWRLEARQTSGHSVGGMTYVLQRGAEQQLAFVGDAIFCYSIGKADAAYEGALAQIREQILSLSDDTIICPGHGPLTTVGFEKAHNPFFLPD
jgi:glyoxylase-like metal-dependent hydrolase (beta-lactamase superfamily II)